MWLLPRCKFAYTLKSLLILHNTVENNLILWSCSSNCKYKLCIKLWCATEQKVQLSHNVYLPLLNNFLGHWLAASNPSINTPEGKMFRSDTTTYVKSINNSIQPFNCGSQIYPGMMNFVIFLCTPSSGMVKWNISFMSFLLTSCQYMISMALRVYGTTGSYQIYARYYGASPKIILQYFNLE